MLRKILPIALVATAFSASVVTAQGRPPAEMPPAGFAGQQYVDSRGCLYARAGLGGQTNWVARIDRARKPICGQTPSRTAMANANAALAAPVEAAAPAVPARPQAQAKVQAPAVAQYVPPPVVYGKPTPLRAPAAAASAAVAAPAPAAPVQHYAQAGQPYDKIAPEGTYGFRATIGGHPELIDRNLGCPAATPYGRIYALTDGRDMLLCANEPHKLRNISTEAVGRYGAISGGRPVVLTPAQNQVATSLTTPPPGYKAAWEDDRLNAHRGGTAQGRQQMAQVWTETVPQDLRHPASTGAQQVAVASSKSQVAPVRAGRFVQVGSFGVAANASRAAARLQGMGLPVQISQGQIRGKAVQIVRAGPFADGQQAQAALGAARGAGFADAILR